MASSIINLVNLTMLIKLIALSSIRGLRLFFYVKKRSYYHFFSTKFK
ncbi:hypothetical protein LDG_6641 [Legionella drancourtii LLAP12]|uniref:Uncharacterized protein n=1 Tax=Legionella drancourtii LLAP12 TaxID=658187 RepID=G9EN21_9GAMM|nr:hypothetical protein LDG_6641 [Legionella drancourtii LLAP12]